MKTIVRYLPTFATLFAMLVMLAQPAEAQTGANLANLQIGFFLGRPENVFQVVINLFLLIAGITAFFFILYGGFVYLTAGGDAAKATQGRTYIVNAVIGVIIIFAAYALARFVINITQREGSTSTTF